MTAVEVPGGQLIKVEPRADPTHFLRAASSGDGHAAAAALLGQVVADAGLTRAPLPLLASHAEVSMLACLPFLFALIHSDSSIGSLGCASTCDLHVLACIPRTHDGAHS